MNKKGGPHANVIIKNYFSFLRKFLVTPLASLSSVVSNIKLTPFASDRVERHRNQKKM